MIREHRYFVLKLKDMRVALSNDQFRTLYELERQVAGHRAVSGKPPLECVVVEKDWPEYEPTWAAIAARIDSEAKP